MSAPSIQTSEPSTSTGFAARASSAPIAARASGSGATARRVAAAGSGRASTSNAASNDRSRKTGPRCGASARANASSRSAASAAVVCTVADRFVTGASSGGWSSSCSAPLPQLESAARPPSTTTGDPLKCAVVTAETPLVMPGPAVSTARPGRRVSLAVASAAKTAVCSCRTSRIGIGGSAFTAPSYSGKTWPPESVNMVRTPCARATSTEI